MNCKVNSFSGKPTEENVRKRYKDAMLTEEKSLNIF